MDRAQSRKTLPTSYSSLRQFTKLEPGVRVREFSEPDKARFVHSLACPDARTGRCRRRESRPTGSPSFRAQLSEGKQQDAQSKIGGDPGPQPPLIGSRQGEGDGAYGTEETRADGHHRPPPAHRPEATAAR